MEMFDHKTSSLGSCHGTQFGVVVKANRKTMSFSPVLSTRTTAGLSRAIQSL